MISPVLSTGQVERIHSASLEDLDQALDEIVAAARRDLMP